MRPHVRYITLMGVLGGGRGGGANKAEVIVTCMAPIYFHFLIFFCAYYSFYSLRFLKRPSRQIEMRENSINPCIDLSYNMNWFFLFLFFNKERVDFIYF